MRTKSTTITFQQNTEFLGRNGVARMSGVLVEPDRDGVMLTPITSKNRIGRSYLLVPLEKVPAVARAMLKVCGTRQRVVISVRGGVAETVNCPPGISVKIIDYDNLEEEKAEKRRVA